MKCWSDRSKEIAYAYNPAFCGEIILRSIDGYCNEKNDYMPFTQIIFILPLLLYKNASETLTPRCPNLLHWIKRDPILFVNLQDRIKKFYPITQEALLFLVKNKFLKKYRDGFAIDQLDRFSREKFTDIQLNKYFEKARKIGMLFSHSGGTENIYIIFGVKP